MLTPDLIAIHNLLFRNAVQNDLVMVRLSSRARRLIFKSSLRRGVEIVIPRHANLSWVTEMTQNRIPWIRSAQESVKDGRSQLNPTHINLTALGELWSVDYAPIDEVPRGVKVNEARGLTVGVDSTDIFYAPRKLQGWFHQKAKGSLLPWLASIAEERQLNFKKIYIKNQVSLWGSCSKKRNINLNRNLLFLPKHLVEYVLHHELTHLNHLDHSERFWSAFSSVVPNCRDLRRELRSLNPEDIPLWASIPFN